ncbi:MAG: glycosyltransferase [Flavobacteriia bacterium]|nr:glycosyltransferase [Flavobacteriia bacterium]
MKIAILGTAYPYRGGIAAFNERLAKELIAEGHQLSIHTFKLQYPNFLFPGKTQFSSDKKPQNINIERRINSVNPINWITTGLSLRKENYDVVIIPFWLPFMGASLGTISRILKSEKTQLLCIAHNIIPHELRLGDKMLTRYFIKKIDGFLAMTQKVLDDLNVFDKSSPKVLTPHPIYDNFGEIEPREKAIESLKLNQDYRYILFFGLIRDYKGLDLLLEAFSANEIREKNIKLIIAGEYYSNQAPYKKLIEKYNLEQDIIQVEQFIPDSEVHLYFNACDLVVQPYKSATQSGVTQIAYHFNKPMIVTDVGGLKEMCPDSKVGYVVSPHADEIKKAILKFFNETNINEMIENINQIKEQYSWSIFTKKLLALTNSKKNNISS